MITLERVHKRFGHTHAVNNASFNAPDNAVMGILGPNGAGKTTTVRMIAGLLPPTDGTITVNTLDAVDDNPKLRAAIGYLPEGNPLHPEMPVRSYLAYRAALQAITRPKRRTAVGEAIERCALNDVAAKRCGHLSKGFRQRVGLAAAILHNPEVLILDEPTSGLDPQQITHMRAVIKDLAEQRTILLISHILAEVQSTCDHLAIFNKSRVLAAGPTNAITTQHAPPPTLTATVDKPQSDITLTAARTADPKADITHAPAATDPNAVTITITPKHTPPGDIARAIAKAAGHALTHLAITQPTLEGVYLNLINSTPTPLQGNAGRHA